jgi:hypothetical protein
MKHDTLIAVEPAPQSPAGFIVTLEGTSLFLTVLVSTSILLAGGIKLISKFNIITAELRDLREDLNTHEQLIQQVKTIQKDVCTLDKRFDIHLQDYVNYKDATLLAINGNKERVEHKGERLENYYEELKGEIKELQGFLHKRHDFRVRD